MCRRASRSTRRTVHPAPAVEKGGRHVPTAAPDDGHGLARANRRRPRREVLPSARGRGRPRLTRVRRPARVTMGRPKAPARRAASESARTRSGGCAWRAAAPCSGAFAYITSSTPWIASSPPGPRMRGAQDLCASRVDHDLHEALASRPSRSRAADARHRPLADQHGGPRARASASVMPTRPSGGSM